MVPKRTRAQGGGGHLRKHLARVAARFISRRQVGRAQVKDVARKDAAHGSAHALVVACDRVELLQHARQQRERLVVLRGLDCRVRVPEARVAQAGVADEAQALAAHGAAAKARQVRVRVLC